MKLLNFYLIIYLFSAPLLAENSACAPELSEGTRVQLEELYLHLHKNPELSFQEIQTAARVATELRALDFEVTEGVGGTGVVAVLSNGAGPTVMLRMDMDGLPVQEETNVPYASFARQQEQGETKPVMHACGHDMHMTNLIGAAQLLSKMRNDWSGTLLIVAQPAEEKGAGARAMLRDGLFSRFPRPDFAVAHHVDASAEAGTISLREGFHTANVDSVDILVRGRGGHGARPHQTKDPIVIASQIVLALQTIVSREIDPLAPAVVTVGSFHGGSKHNIIPDEARLQLTVRSYSDETRRQLLESIERVAQGVGRAAGLEEDLLPVVTQPKEEYTPAGYNDPTLVETARALWTQHFGADRVLEGEQSMGGEDFACYGQVKPKIPSLLFRLGVVDRKRLKEKNLPPLHSSKFLPAYQKAIGTGVQAMTLLALKLFGSCDA
ncbi:MAG: amidohydrolase [Bdellovibrionales bacterium]|nr:amidohydrolase [Bdellovibrionales bacterium]